MREHSIKVRRSARYYTLGPDDERAVRDVWFVLHGYGQLAAQFIGIFEALNDGTRLIVAPEALNRFYVAGVETAPAAERGVGATWMTREDRLNEIDDYVAAGVALNTSLETRIGQSPLLVIDALLRSEAIARADEDVKRRLTERMTTRRQFRVRR